MSSSKLRSSYCNCLPQLLIHTTEHTHHIFQNHLSSDKWVLGICNEQPASTPLSEITALKIDTINALWLPLKAAVPNDGKLFHSCRQMIISMCISIVYTVQVHIHTSFHRASFSPPTQNHFWWQRHRVRKVFPTSTTVNGNSHIQQNCVASCTRGHGSHHSLASNYC